MFDVIIVGGGVHGVLTALYLHSENNRLRISIFEKAKQLLSSYSETETFPYNDQPFSRKDLDAMFHKKGIQVYKSSAVTAINFEARSTGYEIKTRRAVYKAPKVVFCSGKDRKILGLLQDLSLAIDEVVPAAFPLESNDPRLVGLGQTEIPIQLSWVKMSPPKKKIRIQLASGTASKPIKQLDGQLQMRANMISGPVVYQLTQFITSQLDSIPNLIKVCINWTPEYGLEGIVNYLKEAGQLEGPKTVIRTPLFTLPRRLWTSLVLAARIDRKTNWEDLEVEQYQDLAEQLSDSQLTTKPALYKKGLIAYKGGVALSAMDKSGQSMENPGIYFSGSIRSDHLTHIKGNSKTVVMSIKTLAKKIAV